LLGPGSASSCTWGFGSLPTADGEGLYMDIDSTPIVLRFEDLGELIQRPIFCKGGAAATRVFIGYATMADLDPSKL